jgi:hypothetical protein
MKSTGRILFTRLLAPAAGLLVLLILKTPLIRENVINAARVHRWLDAFLVFFIVFFFLRLLDALFQGWYQRRGRRFPIPRLLHTVILGIIYLAAFFIVLKVILNVSITPFLATSALLTMILGLAFQDLLQKQPSLAESIADIISRRNRENQQNLEKIRELSSEEIKKSTDKKSILSRLKSFFS